MSLLTPPLTCSEIFGQLWEGFVCRRIVETRNMRDPISVNTLNKLSQMWLAKVS